jgi:2-polyprenyl-3-methyl-5-hydroxy-6-metoxy-1,4-benzoquinol methylase
MSADANLSMCPICDGFAFAWRTKATEHGRFDIHKCRCCGYAFVNPRPTFSYLMDFYSSSGHSHTACHTPIVSAADALASEARFPNSTLDATRIVRTMTELLGDNFSERRFLDVGCGYGFYTREAIHSGFEVSAIELASNERTIAKELTGIGAIDVSFESYQVNPGTFSAILMSQILEHVQDVNLWVEKAHSLLKTNGVLAIAVPNFGSVFRHVLQENEPFITPPSHLNFFNSGTLHKLLEKHDFKILGTQWVSRISPSGFERRLPGATKSLAPLLQFASKQLLGIFDLLRVGQLVTVYAGKISKK